MKKITKIISLFVCLLIIGSTSFAAGAEDFIAAVSKEFVPIQEKYDSLSEVTPCYIMLQPTSSSMISQELLDALQDKLNREMINTGKMKPVLLDKWLTTTFGINKSKNSKAFINTIADERYPCLITGACSPYVFKTSDGYVIMLSFYRFIDSGFPIQTFRRISSLSECSEALISMLNEYLKIIETKSYLLFDKKKIVVKPFILESRKYMGQSTGDFDYIPSTFIEQDGILITATDDYFSRLLTYSLYTTQMLNAVSALDLNTYVDSSATDYDYADFYIEGRIQLTDQINIFHISLFEAKTKKLIKDVKFFSSDFSLHGIWNANSNIVYSLAPYIFGNNSYGVSPDISVPGQGLYLNNMFIGWDNLEKCVLPKGKHIIYTGNYINMDSTVEINNKNKAVDINGNIYRSFFLYLDERNWIFRGKDGERVWNLLEK